MLCLGHDKDILERPKLPNLFLAGGMDYCKERIQTVNPLFVSGKQLLFAASSRLYNATPLSYDSKGNPPSATMFQGSKAGIVRPILWKIAAQSCVWRTLSPAESAETKRSKDANAWLARSTQPIGFSTRIVAIGFLLEAQNWMLVTKACEVVRHGGCAIVISANVKDWNDTTS